MLLNHYRLSAWAVILLVFLVHVGLASSVPLGVDEAHYALYALFPDLSYFDHPPMVGWLQMLVSPLGFNEFTVRLIPALLYAISSLLVYRLSFRLFPSGPASQGWIAVFLLNSSLILQLMGWGLVPDLPLMVFALLAVDRAYQVYESNRLTDWLVLGVVFGLAGLSKYTAVFLPLGLVLFMIQHKGLSWLAQTGPWLAALVSLVIISPVLIWNAQNDWVSLAYQFDRGVGVKEWELGEALGMQVAQMLLYTILAYVAAIAATFACIRKKLPEAASAPAWLVIWSAMPSLLVISWSAGDGTVLPNWPAMGWTLMAPLSAYWIATRWEKIWVKCLTAFSSLLSVGLVLFLFAFLAFMPLSTFPFMGPAIKDLVGWKEASERALALKEEMEQEEQSPVLLVDNWSKASRVAWYAYPHPVQLITDRTTQFDFWYGSPDPTTRGILVRDKKEVPEEGLYTKEGIECQLLETMKSEVDGVLVNQFQFYRCEP